MTQKFINEETTEGFSIAASGDVAGIELRMLPPLIKDNHTVRCWPFPGRARLYCLTMVVSDTANQLSGQMDLNAFPRVGDNEYLPINKTIFYWQQDEAGLIKSPSQLHVMTSIIKSKEGLRETGEILEKVKRDDEYKGLMDKLTSIITDTASLSTVANLTMQAAHIIGQYLGHVDDQPIGTVIRSFTRLHGDWDNLGVHPIHIPTRDVDFEYELIIRDSHRLEAAHKEPLVLPISYLPPSATVGEMIPM